MCCGDAIPLATLAQRLSYLRRCAGLWEGRDVTHKEIGAALRVTAVTVGAWERGGNKPHRDRLEAIARLYSVDVGWLLTGHGDPPSGVRFSLPPSQGVALGGRRRRKEG